MRDKYDYRNQSLTSAPCALCAGNDFEPLAECDRYGFGLATVGCRRCGLVQTNPRPSDIDLDSFYKEHYRTFYQGIKRPNASYVTEFGKEVRLRYTANYLATFLDGDSSKSLLDFGCGEGSLFAALRTQGVSSRLFGIEPNASFADFARERAADAVVFESLDEVLAADMKFDIVVLNHVLEHFAHPRTMLNSIKALLTPTGQLYVDVPDVERYRSIDDLHIAHLLHFDLRTLRAMLRSVGLREEALEAHEPPHHPASIRAMARSATVDSLLPDALSAISGWNAVKAVQSKAWISMLKRRMARIPGVSAVWRAGRLAVRRSARKGDDRR